MMANRIVAAVFAGAVLALGQGCVECSSAANGEGRIKALLERYVEGGRISGVVSGISDRSGNVWFDCVGWADVERRLPISRCWQTSMDTDLTRCI